jgi:flagellar basal body-associated protein FliL
MENTKIKIILSVIVFLSVVGFAGAVNATGASLYVSPASIAKTAGNVFSASVGFNASGNKVCAVEGTLVFNNLSCQSITVASDADIVAQSAPTCLNPHFLIGIQNCTTSDRVLLTASVKAGSAGAASVSATVVDIIGEGSSVGSASTNGNYTISAALTSVPTPKPASTSVSTLTTPISAQSPIATPTEQIAQGPSAAGQQASLANTSPAKTITIIIIVLLVIAVIGGLWYMSGKKKNKQA